MSYHRLSPLCRPRGLPDSGVSRLACSPAVANVSLWYLTPTDPQRKMCP